MDEYTNKLEQLSSMAMEYAPKLIGAILIIIIGLWIIGKMMDLVGKAMDRSGLSQDIQPFLKSLFSVILKVMLFFSAAGMVGIETTSFVAVLAAAGFAIGMALQGSLGNFAAGVMILVFKPYKVGDVVDVQDQVGHVKEIQIFNTLIKTPDNKIVIVPNGLAISGIITNLTTEKILRVDFNVSMPYAEEYDKIEKIILDALHNTPKVLSDPKPRVGIDEFDSHSVQLAVMPYAETEDYWDVYFDAKKNVKAALGKAGVKVAYSEGVELGDIGK